MSSARKRTIRYRCLTAGGPPFVGLILMGTGPAVRRAYRVLSATKIRSSMKMLGISTWRLIVEPMSADRGREEIAAGVRHWFIKWDRRG